jgi:hypothetical protein
MLSKVQVMLSEEQVMLSEVQVMLNEVQVMLNVMVERKLSTKHDMIEQGYTYSRVFEFCIEEERKSGLTGRT